MIEKITKEDIAKCYVKNDQEKSAENLVALFLSQIYEIIDAVNTLQTKDSEIVHCKDCKWWTKGINQAAGKQIGNCHNVNAVNAFGADYTEGYDSFFDFFCSHGQRKAENGK